MNIFENIKLMEKKISILKMQKERILNNFSCNPDFNVLREISMDIMILEGERECLI